MEHLHFFECFSNSNFTSMKLNQQEIIKKTKAFVKEKLDGEGSGHDWWHVYRVWHLAKHITQKERGANNFIVELAALLHDIADWKLHGGDETIGPKTARTWLEKVGVENNLIDHITDIIRTMAFKGAKVEVNSMKTKEEMIVQDADRLDAIGAVGIARTFTFGGYKGRPMWDPSVKPILHKNAKDYFASADVGNTINHFYEKLLLLKDRMNTKTAKKLAEGRSQFMEKFLDRFYKEWEGKK